MPGKSDERHVQSPTENWPANSLPYLRAGVYRVNDSPKKRKKMSHPLLWFSTREEDKHRSQLLKQELNEIKEALSPIMESLNENQHMPPPSLN